MRVKSFYLNKAVFSLNSLNSKQYNFDNTNKMEQINKREIIIKSDKRVIRKAEIAKQLGKIFSTSDIFFYNTTTKQVVKKTNYKNVDCFFKVTTSYFIKVINNYIAFFEERVVKRETIYNRISINMNTSRLILNNKLFYKKLKEVVF